MKGNRHRRAGASGTIPSSLAELLQRAPAAVLLIAGELNTFAPADAPALLAAARRALAPEGSIVLEVHTEEFVRELGAPSTTWFTAERGLFSDQPHLCLRESAWHPGPRAATERYYVVDAATGEVATFTSTTQAYSDAAYNALLKEAGLEEVARHDSLAPGMSSGDDGLFVLEARRG